MTEWIQDGLDHGWFNAKGIGSIRSRESYRAGGWWFLPAWLPDESEHDIGPFKTKAGAMSSAMSLHAKHVAGLDRERT